MDYEVSWKNILMIRKLLVVMLVVLLGAGPVSAAPDLYVDFGYPGEGDGTAQNPYSSLADALSAAQAGETIGIDVGTGIDWSGETMSISTPVRLDAIGGPVRIGFTDVLEFTIFEDGIAYERPLLRESDGPQQTSYIVAQAHLVDKDERFTVFADSPDFETSTRALGVAYEQGGSVLLMWFDEYGDPDFIFADDHLFEFFNYRWVESLVDIRVTSIDGTQEYIPDIPFDALSLTEPLITHTSAGRDGSRGILIDPDILNDTATLMTRISTIAGLASCAAAVAAVIATAGVATPALYLGCGSALVGLLSLTDFAPTGNKYVSTAISIVQCLNANCGGLATSVLQEILDCLAENTDPDNGLPMLPAVEEEPTRATRPVFDPPSGSFQHGDVIHIEAPNVGATLVLVEDLGPMFFDDEFDIVLANPGEESITVTYVVYAIAPDPSWVPSPRTRATFTIDPYAPDPPVLFPPPGTFTTSIDVEVGAALNNPLAYLEIYLDDLLQPGPVVELVMDPDKIVEYKLVAVHYDGDWVASEEAGGTYVLDPFEKIRVLRFDDFDRREGGALPSDFRTRYADLGIEWIEYSTASSNPNDHPYVYYWPESERSQTKPNYFSSRNPVEFVFGETVTNLKIWDGTNQSPTSGHYSVIRALDVNRNVVAEGSLLSTPASIGWLELPATGIKYLTMDSGTFYTWFDSITFEIEE